jgi:hypothetical protein
MRNALLLAAVAASTVALPAGELHAQQPAGAAAAIRPAPRAEPRAGAVRPALNAVRAIVAPTIDGILDDAAWTAADAGSDFTQLQPRPGEPASERTEVRIVYDDDAIYVAMRMYDSSPDSIVARLARRDENGAPASASASTRAA